MTSGWLFESKIELDSQWFFESISADGSHVTYNITHLPFRVGRDKSNDLTVASFDLSRHHAVLTADISGRIRLTDLNSTNGSSVNRERIEGSCLLKENDIVHFGPAEFRLGIRRVELARVDEARTMLAPQGLNLSELFVPNESQFYELLAGQGMSGAAQPIVEAAGGRIVAYELLGRANHPGLPGSPARLFQMARALGREVELSEAFRNFSIEAPAHFVKFDMGLVHDIHLASERKRHVVRDLVKLVLDLGSVPLAEGIEKEGEAQVCREMGFQLMQGFLSGKPLPLHQLPA